MKRKELKVKIAVNKAQEKKLNKIFKRTEKYFKVNYSFESATNLEKITKDKPNFLFIGKNNVKYFEGLYSKFKNRERSFKVVAISDKPDSAKDIQLFKELMDDIVYTVDEELLYWKIISLFRRRWDDFNTGSTIINGNIIADFVDGNVIVGDKQVEFTNKELKLLRFFLLNIDTFVTKSEIFKAVWGYKGDDTTRTVDQMIFKVKRKVGEEHFMYSRTKGFKFS